MKITNIPASARALAYEEKDGGVVADLCRGGLVIEPKSIEFPDHLLNSVTWAVGMLHEILAGEDRRWLDQSEINEMEALGRLLARLKKMGGVQVLAPEFDSDSVR